MAVYMKHNYNQAFQTLDYFSLKRLLTDNANQVAPEMAHRLKCLKRASLINTLTRPWDKMFFGRKIASAKLAGDPVFVLGHWRSGTTLVHNFLARDSRFTYPNMVHAFTPFSFLTLGRFTTALLDRFLPETRIVDQVRLGSQEPQEDEFALAIMCGLSPYFEMLFPKRRDFYARYFRMNDISDSELSLWKETFLTFLKKITLQDPRPLVLKSPSHTARLSLLRTMFPNARFIHIVRNPYDVYRSMWNLYDNYISLQHLQKVSRETAGKNMLKNYRALFAAFEEDRNEVPKNRLALIKYEEFVQDPLAKLRGIYCQLELGEEEEVFASLSAYLESIKGYHPNPKSPLTTKDIELVNSYCSQVFDTYGYKKEQG